MFQKQPVMRRVLASLAPLFLFSIYLYGPRSIAILAVSLLVGAGVELLFERKRGKKPSEAVLVTGALLALSMPPTVPLWIVAVGAAFAVFMAKEVYGGFGRNVFNPAIAGRLFVYISFVAAMQSGFLSPGAFGTAVDAVGGATPLVLMRGGEGRGLGDLILGLRAGALGESSALLIALAGIYLLATKTASYRLMLSTLVSGASFAALLLALGVAKALPLESLLAGSFLFVAVFMATDPVSAPKKPAAQWLYGALIGCCVILIRTFSLFPEGTSFAVLLGNSAASLLDDAAAAAERRRAARDSRAPAAAPAPEAKP
ncbi:MAG TPA: RnfABCDGE type electron transport complex subunit D [Spirochaetales bacterium]|nr:RnfABCDGE type electron transport complex subunit D [Spirochaetales bacterium]HRY55974.1 RnfABCDGE type electron transport complex subunit D [Spirochaetia bacterium]HRZ65939.1 RnfABCDGE type electron transport complex subunit D [Spirochaetia bacterium]